MMNEFEMDKPSKSNVRYNKAVLRVHWYPAACELIRKYFRDNKACDLCDSEGLETPSLVLTKEGQELFDKVKAGKSTVINIKSLVATKDETKAEISCKTKALMNELKWDHSLFKDIAATCKSDGSKLQMTNLHLRKCL